MTRWTHNLSSAELLPRVRWHTAQWQRTLGFPGMLALLLIGAFLAIHYGVIAAGLRDNAVRLQEAQAGIDAQPQNVNLRASKAVQQLPLASTFEARLETVQGILQRNGFAVLQTTYQHSTNTTDQTQRLDMEIPLQGQYPALREALNRLAPVPALRIESLRVERKNIAQQQLDIQLKLSLLGARP